MKKKDYKSRNRTVYPKEKVSLDDFGGTPAPEDAHSAPNTSGNSNSELDDAPKDPLLGTTVSRFKTLEELLEQDKLREKDGFPRKIRLGKIVKPGNEEQGQVVVVPTTTESKLYHDDSVTEDQDQGSTGGTGEGEEGEVIGQQPARPDQGQGSGAGQGDDGDHKISSGAFELGKVLTEQFHLPNLQDKGKKRSLTRYIYDLTDRNRGFGQLLDKKATLKRVIKTNILLDRIDPSKEIMTENMIIDPRDLEFRILSREKDFESQAIVFFLRDYSGSMEGKPTETVTTQHLFIYSWLMYQYKTNVESRFIVHDAKAKEVKDFYTYYKSQVAGGTQVFPAFQLVNQIVEKEQLHKDYNIYVFYGTDGDDWDSTGKSTLEAIREMLGYVNRIGITVARNAWTRPGSDTYVEKYLKSSNLLESHEKHIKLDAIDSNTVSEDRIIEGIKKLVE
ncbi:MAG: DUF444 family protein [Bacteroidales bacterium]